MLDIRIDGFSVDLLPDTALVLTKRNPMFVFNEIPGSYVLAFSLPITPRNRRILGFFEHLQTARVNRIFYCEKYVDSNLIERGYVKVQDADSTKYNLYFTQNLNEIFGDYQQQLLSQIPFGTVSMPTPAIGANQLTDAFCWPTIENAAFYGNTTVSGFAGLLNQYNTGSSSFTTPARVPQLFLRWVLSRYGTLTGWSFSGDFWDDPTLQRLILFNLFCIDGKSTLSYQNHLPDMTMPQLLVGLRNLFNLLIEFDVSQKKCSLNLVENLLKTPEILDWSTKVANDYTKRPDLNNRLELSFDIDSNDAFMKPVPADLDTYQTAETLSNAGGSVMPLRTSFSTLSTSSLSRGQISQPGTSTTNKEQTQTTTKPKLLFWNGAVAGEPRATNAHGSYKLAWHGSNNLVTKFWHEFEAFKGETFSMSRIVSLTPADVARFSFRNRVHIRGVDYLVSSIDMSLKGNSSVIPAKVELWKA